MGLSKAFKALMRKDSAQQAGSKVPKKKKLTHQDVFELKLKVHRATSSTTVDQWKHEFSVMDKKGRGYLSFDEFRRAVRRANIKTSVITDEELQDVVLVVDADGSGQIDVEEFLSFLKPDDIPDIKARASSWTDNEGNNECDMATAGRGPMNAVNSVGASMTHDGYMVHTGDLNGNAWNTRLHATSKETFIEFEFPEVYFLNLIHFWNYMSTDRRTCKDEQKCSLKAFDVSYSLNGTRWYKMGHIGNLTEMSPFGVSTFFGESIVGPEFVDASMLPFRHQRSPMLRVEGFFGPPAKFIKFHGFENWGGKQSGNMFGINGVLFYGTRASGDCILSNQSLTKVPEAMHEMYQFVINLDISHNSIVELPDQVSMMVLVRKMVISHNYIEKYPKVLNEGDFPSTLTHLDMSHNLLTILPPDVANLKKLEILLLAGHYWEEGGLPLELANLNFLKTIDLSGFPNLQEWLWRDEERARHGLLPSGQADRTVITESEFLAFVREHPLLLHSLSEAGAKGMFYRAAGDERRKMGAGAATLKVNGETAISMASGNELDEKILRIFCRPFPGLSKDVYDMDSLEELYLERSGVAVYLPPADLPTLPAHALSGAIANSNRLGILSLFKDQAEQHPGVIHVPLPNITSAAGLVETKRILEERGMWEEPKIHFDAKASESEMSASLRYEADRLSAHTNPPLPKDAPERYRDQTWQRKRAGGGESGMAKYVETGPDALAKRIPEYTFTPQNWHSSRPVEGEGGGRRFLSSGGSGVNRLGSGESRADETLSNAPITSRAPSGGAAD